jgi:type I restriction enzyme, S subunit
MAGDFDVQPLGTVAKVRSGYAFKSEDMGSVGLPVIKIKNVSPPTVDITDCERVPEEVILSIPRVERFELKEGDTLIAMTGATVGKVGKFPRTHERHFLNQRVGKVYLTEPGAADSHYIYYILSQETYVRQMFGIADGSAQANISGSQIESLEVPLPPLVEQKAIAAVLGALDDKIELNRRMNATLETMARALFQSWFVDFDPVRVKLDGRQPTAVDAATAALFPEHLENSALGLIPQGWKVGKVGDIGTNARRGVQPNEIAPGTSYIALEHMPRRSIALGAWDGSADVASGKSAFKKGEILFGKLRPYFHKVGVAPFDGVCSTDILVLTPRNPEWFALLLCHASSDELVQFTDLASTGTKMPRTNWADISSFKIVLPPKQIAAAFTNAIQPLIDRIHANLHQSRTLANLRDTLLPKLLSGELSVKSIEEAVSA